MPEPVHIGDILKGRVSIMKALHVCQKEVEVKNPHVAVLLAMIQMCLLEGDEADLSKWMSFYMMKKLQAECTPEFWEELQKKANDMPREELEKHARAGLDLLNNQRNELFKKIDEERSEDNG